jgi:putative nucleotidyltransferase with HDIG domain
VSPRTIAALGAVLGQEVQALARQAMQYVSVRSSTRDAQVERALEVLVDRLCLSLALSKPVGLLGWAERQAQRIGRSGVIDLAGAASHAIVEAGTAYEVDHWRLQAFLEVLSVEIRRAADGANPRERDTNFPWGESATALMAMLGERDYATCCHSKATAEWSRRLALAMGNSQEQIDHAGLCGLLHDVGKVATPETVLLKPSALDAAEWKIMREHAAHGARILNQIPSLQHCAIAVRAHHERFDGTGYPDGLDGISIPLESRIVAVADAFHAMISERPYRRPIAPRQALNILREGRASQWAPDAVDAMLGMFEQRTISVARAGGYLSSA